jgi:hypothetical protein
MDPFDGVWVFSPGESQLASPPPRAWTQRIDVTRDDIHIVEDIRLADGTSAKVIVAAKFDGTDYPVQGSPIADAIAYTRTDIRSISGSAKQGGRLTFEETVTVSEDGCLLTTTFSIPTRTGERTTSVAVFERVTDVSESA